MLSSFVKANSAIPYRESIMEKIPLPKDLSDSSMEHQKTHRPLKNMYSDTSIRRVDSNTSPSGKKMIAIYNLRKNQKHEEDYNENDLNMVMENRKEVKNLEKWQNEMKAKKEVRNVTGQNKKDKKTNDYPEIAKISKVSGMPEIEPYIDQELLNAIMREKGIVEYEAWKSERQPVKNDKKRPNIDKNLIYTGKGQGSGGPVPEPIKNLETIRAETNKKLLNEILYDKVAKQMTEHKVDLKENSKLWSKEAGNNFKTLQNTFGPNMTNLIQYESLFQRIFTKKNLPQSHFDFSEFSDRLEKEKNNFESKEHTLLVYYDEIKKTVKFQKEQLKKIRSAISQTRSKLKNLRDQVLEITKRYNDMEERMLHDKAQKTNKPKTVIFNFTKNMDNHVRVERIQEEKTHHLKQTEEMINKTVVDLNRLKREHEVFAGQLIDFQMKKQTIRLKLKELYLNMVKQDPNYQKAMTWIVKSLWNIGEEVTSDIFPKVLDEKNIKFLLKLAKKELQANQLSDTILRVKTDHDLHSKKRVTIKGSKLFKRDVKAGVEEIKAKLNKIKKVTKCQRPIYDEKSARSRYYLNTSDNENLNEENDDSDKGENENIFSEAILDLSESEKVPVLEESLLKTRQKIEELKIKEIKRITDIYSKKPASEKNFLELHNILIILLGENESNKILEESLKDRFITEKKLQKNQTFSFFQDEKTSDFYKRYLSGRKRGQKETQQLKAKFGEQSEKLKSRIAQPDEPSFDVRSTMSIFFNRPQTSQTIKPKIINNLALERNSLIKVHYDLTSPKKENEEEVVGSVSGDSQRKELNSNSRVMTATTRFLSTESRGSSRVANNYFLANSFNKVNFKHNENDNGDQLTSVDNFETLETEESSYQKPKNQLRHIYSANRQGWFSEKKSERVQTANPELSTRK